MTHGQVESTPTITVDTDHTRMLTDGGLQVFTAILDHSATPTELAQRLHMAQARVNFILGQLVHDGLVSVESERSDGERVERRYRATVSTFGLQANAQSSVAGRLQTARYIIGHLQSGLLQSIALQQPGVAMFLVQARVPKDRLQEYSRRLAALQAEFDAEAGSSADPWYSMALALYPGSAPAEGK